MFISIMNIERENDPVKIDGDGNVYSLITELAAHTLQTYRPFYHDSYSAREYIAKAVKRLRAKAFGILLNKIDDPSLSRGHALSEDKDPITEILKHAFALRVAMNRAHDATMLERLVEEFGMTSNMDETHIYSVLQLLVELKSFKTAPEPVENIFSYGKANPVIPEMINTGTNVPLFQVYPMECFILSDKFEATLQTQSLLHIKQNIPINFATRQRGFLHNEVPSSRAIVAIESVGTSTGSGFKSRPLSLNRCFGRDMDTSPSFFTEFSMHKAENCDIEFITSSERGLVTSYLHLPCARMELNYVEDDSIFDMSKSSEHSFLVESDHARNNYNSSIWTEIDITNTSLSNLRTWESFGEIQSRKEPPFITDLPNAAVHLVKILQTSSLLLLSEKLIKSTMLLEEVPSKEFLKDVKSMFLGVESYSFNYEDATGFALRRDISTFGVCPRSLETICQEPIKWGNCFRFLSCLVTSDPQTGKLSQEGLIFKAMCNSIKEFLLYYRVVLLRIFTSGTNEEPSGLLQLLRNVRPVGLLISQVSKLCESYKETQCMFEEGNGILTRIYKEVIKVTDAKIGLVFYSILNSCCQVYFRYLQKWMFEGLCDDIYGEFMIKTQPQFLRIRGRKFWTKSFSVCNLAVPGFLSGLTELILQCGKTVRLLRICNPKNPVCSVCITEQPEVRVCLSVTMLHDQLSRCRVYEEKGKHALGPILSLSSAIGDRIRAEKKTAELVMRAQRDALSRIRGQQEDLYKNITQTKQLLFANLKEEAMRSSMQKRKVKEDEIRNDRILLDAAEQKERILAEEMLNTARTNLLNYYEDLASEIDKRRAKSLWRAERMSLYDKRVDALAASKRDLPKIIENSQQRIINSSFEDENRNIASTMERTSETTESNEVTEPCITIKVAHEDAEQNKSLLTNYAYRQNPGAGQNILNVGKLEALVTKTIANSSITISEETENIVKSSRVDNMPIAERPTFLSFGTVDDNTKPKLCGSDALPDYMTPNNNEFKLPYSKEDQRTVISTCTDKKLDRNMERNFLDIKESTNFSGANDLETPMSCTTDNFTSSMQSPMSHIQNSEVESPVEVSSNDASSSITAEKEEQPTPILDSFGVNCAETMPTSWLSSNVAPPSLTIADVESIDHTSLQVYLEKSIRIPLMIQTRLVNNAIIKYFLKEHNLLLHFHSLRSYFFLLNGEFAKSLTDSLYTRLYEISVPLELFNSATLTNLLERALMNSLNNAYVNSELLSLSAIHTPVQLHVSDPSTLDCLTLNYKITWPLNIILDETVMLQYGKVFKFLVTSGRVSWVLQEDFTIMKRQREAATSEQYHRLQLYRHSMTQFMHALHNYLTCSVLHASWVEFEKDLQNSTTLDQIYISHVSYIKGILSRCMLNSNGEKMRICINNIFKVILKFHNRLRSKSWVLKSVGYVHPNYKSLEKMYRAFCELRAYMAHVAFKMATSGYKPHLMHFLNALNINNLYDLTVKTGGAVSSTGASTVQ